MTAKTTTVYSCNLCGAVPQEPTFLRGIIFDTDSGAEFVEHTASPVHVCKYCITRLKIQCKEPS